MLHLETDMRTAWVGGSQLFGVRVLLFKDAGEKTVHLAGNEKVKNQAKTLLDLIIYSLHKLG
jgi:hypothetical protein